MRQISTSTFAWKPFFKSLLSIALPVALQSLLTTTASMVDTMMIAPLGELSVGAVGLCAQFTSLMFSCYYGFVGGGSLFIAQYFGAKDEDGIERAYGMTLAFMTVVALIFAGMAVLRPGLVMRMYTDKESIQAIGVEYLRIVGFAYIFQVLSMAVSALLRATDRVRIPMIASIFSVATNIFLNWVFIYGRLGAPVMGVRGAALATSLAGVVNLLALYIMARAKAYPHLFRIKNHFRWTKAFLSEYLKKCFPIICNELLVGIGNMTISITLGHQPEHVIVAIAVFRTLEGLIISFFMGFTSAASILVGVPVGAGELDTAFERAKRLVYLCSGTIFATGLIVLALHAPILTAMGLSGESFVAGRTFLIIYVCVSVIRMGNWIQNDTYRASGDAVYGTVLEIVFMYLVVLPAVLITGFVLNAPYWVVFLCCYVDEPVRYALMQRHLYSGKWIKPVTETGRSALPAFRARHGWETKQA